MVRKGGLEPPRDCSHKLLRLASLPIPPLPQNVEGLLPPSNLTIDQSIAPRASVEFIRHVTPFLIGVAGGSASGKSTVVERLAQQLGDDTVAVIEHDRYYKEWPGLPDDQRARLNYDHPDALETDLLIEHLDTLRRGGAVQVPIYDFVRHVRLPRSDRIDPRPIIFVEGLLVLADARVRDALDLRVFVDTDESTRYERRLKRDVALRGRTAESVAVQFAATVQPMHVRFVEPSRQFADVIVAEGGFNDVTVGLVHAHILAALRAQTA